jgi:tetratricopeptide (TPR) repeat protein
MVRRAPGPLVAPAKPMTDAHNTPETLETELNRLVLLLEAVESAWVYAVYDDVPTRDQLIATMRERLAPIAVLERSLAGSGETSPLEFAQQTPVLPNQSAPVICFTGLGNAIMQGHLPNLLDMHREALASTRHRLVFWVRENEWVALLETARNFSSRIAGSFDFREEAEEDLGSKPRVKKETVRKTSEIPRDESLNEYQLENVKTRIHKLNEDNPKDARNLALLYSELGDICMSLDRPRWLESEAAHLKASRFFATVNYAAQAKALMNAARAAFFGDMVSFGLQHTRQAFAIYERIGDHLGQANAVMNIGNIEYYQGEIKNSLSKYREAFSIYVKIGNNRGRAGSLIGIGNVNVIQGELNRALENYNEALEAYRGELDLSSQAMVLTNIGNTAKMQGDFDSSIQSYQGAIRLYFETNDEIGTTHAYAGLIDTYIFFDFFDKEGFYNALNNCYKWLDFCLRINDKLGQATALEVIGNAKKYQNELVQAVEIYNQALDIFTEMGDRFGRTKVTSHLSQVAVLQGDTSKADSLFKEVLETFQMLGYRYHYAEATGDYGLTLNQVGKSLEARPYLERAIELFEALEVPKIAQRYRDALK